MLKISNVILFYRKVISKMQIINIINFVRAVEPRTNDDSFLPLTLKEELKLCAEYGFPSTVLLQYDAIIRPEYIDIIKKYGENANVIAMPFGGATLPVCDK